MNIRYTNLIITTLTLVLAACGSSGPGEPGDQSEIPVELTKLAGDGGEMIAGGALSPSLRVTRDGDPAPGVAVVFSIHSGGGNLTKARVATGIDGNASTTWFLGSAGEPQTLSAKVGEEKVEFSATATEPIAGESHFGRNDYVEYIPGELPIIISAPHGGSLQPGEIPDRTSGTTVQDMNTADLSRRIATALEEITGKRPHLAIMHLHRRKLDANREIAEAAQGSGYAERAWYEYHAWLEIAKEAVSRDQGRGLYLDIHGHGHENQRLELGYLLSATDLARPDSELEETQFAAKSSIRALAEESSSGLSEPLRGEDSLGEILVRKGYPAVPSQSDPHPQGASYFSGGYSTARHGSRDGGVIDGVQIEHNYQGVRDSATNREAYAHALAESILEFLERRMNIEIGEFAMN
jgi:hypothetical protein